MSGWFKLAAYALISLFLGVLLREFGFKGARLVSVLAGVVVIGTCSIGLESLFDSLSFLTDGVDKEYVSDILKIVGIGYVCGVCSDICLDFGEASLASSITAVSRIEMLIISAPYIMKIVKKGLEMI